MLPFLEYNMISGICIQLTVAAFVPIINQSSVVTLHHCPVFNLGNIGK